MRAWVLAFPRAIVRILHRGLKKIPDTINATKGLSKSFSGGGIRLAIYNVDEQIIRFPRSLRELASTLRRSGISDAVGWMPRVSDYLASHPANVVVDIGGYRGVTAQWFAARAGHVHVFEPVDESADTIELALQARRTPNVTLHRFAVSDREGTGTMHVMRGKGHSSLGPAKTSRLLYKAEAPTRTLDNMARELGLTSIDFLKIDVEGYEEEVFRGAANLLQRQAIKGIVFEVNRGVLRRLGRSIKPVIEALRSAGYSIVDLEGRPLTDDMLVSGRVRDAMAFPAKAGA